MPGAKAFPGSHVILYHASLLKVMCGFDEAAAGFIRSDLDEPLVPTYQGRPENKADAIYLIEACLRGKLLHARRRPRDGETTISENIFVWEENRR